MFQEMREGVEPRDFVVVDGVEYVAEVAAVVVAVVMLLDRNLPSKVAGDKTGVRQG